jgi:hypothetical protein
MEKPMGKQTVKVAGKNPEKFIIVGLDEGLSMDGSRQTTEPMTEAELRDDLGKRGISEKGCDQLIAEARRNAV